ncbi:MAG: M48 family metallopeptidase [Limisphaerales bacterium]
MNDFFGHQDRARKNTGKLIFYFIAAIGGTICLIYVVLALIFLRGKGGLEVSAEALWNSKLFMWASGGTLAVVFIGSVMKMAELSAGGKAIAEMLGGRLLDRSTNDRQESQVLNVIEEMAIASGVPVPDTYLMDHEQGINAFAAGNSINDAVIGVTRGCMEQLNRDEFQGVMAHEFSHILNGDMKINLRLTGWIHGLLCIAVIGRVLLYVRGGRDNKGLPMLGLALMIIGGIGMLAGKLIKAAVSRQREFLADASAVQFTRNPNGITGALKKIGGLTSQLENPKAEEASHLFFGNGLGSSFMEAFSTHPPLAQRIQRLDPNFKGAFTEPQVGAGSGQSNLVSGLAGGAAAPPPIPAAPVSTDRVMQQIGEIDAEHIDYAHGLIGSLPPLVVQSAHEPFGAVALSYALLLSPDEEVCDRQVQILQESENPAIVAEAANLSSATADLHERTRIPLIEMSLPALRQLSAAQYGTFATTVQKLAEADRQIDLFEFSLEKLLRRYLDPTFTGDTQERVQFHSLDSLLHETNVFLSALAYLSHEDDEEVANAYRTGVAAINHHHQFSHLPIDQCGLNAVDKAMDRVVAADVRVKERIVKACAECVTADGEIQTGEAEMLRAICAAINIPCPPLL